MKKLSVLALTSIFLGSLGAAPEVFAHATFNVGGYGNITPTGGNNGLPGGTSGGNAIAQTLSGATPVWTNGSTGFLPPTATQPSIGYLGIHSLNNTRQIQTGTYNATLATNLPTNTADPVVNAANAATNAANAATNLANFGSTTGSSGAIGNPSTFNTVTASGGDSLLGQVWNYNNRVNATNSGTNAASQWLDAAHTTLNPNYQNYLPTDVQLAVGANSWAGGISADNTGLDFGNVHASAGSPSNEVGLMALGVNYLNFTLSDDTSDGLGAQQLAFSIYGGWVDGPGLSGLTLLTTQLAANPGDTLGVTLQLFGHDFGAPGTNGEYTVVVGDQGNIGGRYKLSLNASSTAMYANNIVQAVPIPAAVWLFGSALAGMGIIGRRKENSVA